MNFTDPAPDLTGQTNAERVEAVYHWLADQHIISPEHRDMKLAKMRSIARFQAEQGDV